MIVELCKYVIIGNRSEMDRFFELAQRGGFMEFIGLSHKKALEMPEEAKTIVSAIKIARGHSGPVHERYYPSLDPVRLAESIVKVNADHEKLLEEQRMLNAELSRVAVFGDFSRMELDQLERDSKRVFQFFCMKSDLAREATLPPGVIYVGTEYDLDYFVSIHKEKMQYPKMIEIVIERPIGELRERLHQIQLELIQTEQEIHHSARALPYLQNGLLEFLNEYHLQLAKHDALAPMGDALFAIEAWVPKTKAKAMGGLLSGLDVFVEEIRVEEGDKVPTYMENKGAGKVGEDLVLFYDTPSTSDKDPSLWVLIFFALFFAIIVSDAGYGLIYLGLALFLKWKFKTATGALKRSIKLALIASTACIVWGVLTASFFGIQIGPNNPFRKTSFLHSLAVQKAEYHMEAKDDVYQEYVREFPDVATATDGHEFLLKASHSVNGKLKYDALETFYDTILLEFSLFMGFLHLSLSFLRYLRRNWVGLGWIVFMAGGYLYFPAFVDATSFLNFLGLIPKDLGYAIGKQLVFIGLGLVLLIALLQKRKWGALHELTNSIQIFGDALSYLRLYALALAGMMMASTFNELAMEWGVVGMVLTLVVGHIVNLSMTTMSGVIHGLRLNYLEWYHYSFEGGGRNFNPLRIRKFK